MSRNYQRRGLDVDKSSPYYSRAYRNARRAKGECLDCTLQAAPNRARCVEHLKAYADKEALKRKEDKKKCFDHYGRTCTCCGNVFDEIFLTLDHVNNDGAAHRKLMGAGGGRRTYQWAVLNGFPPILQTHCWNCNMAKYHNGGICPHQVKP